MELIVETGRLELEVSRAEEEQKAGSQEIVTALDGINRITQKVREATGDIRSRSGSVELEMENLGSLTVEMQASLSQMVKNLEAVTQRIKGLDELGSRNHRAADELQALTGRFRVEG